jgi:hypothetical protein
MSYIGSSPSQQSYIAGIDYFSGNSSNTTFTLSRQTFSVSDIEVVVANVVQNPLYAYTVSPALSTITFTSAPPTGTNNIYVRYLSRSIQTIAPTPGTVSSSSIQSGAVGPIQLDYASSSGNGAIQLPIGTTSQRPSGAFGEMRYNSQANTFEGYSTTGWGSIGGGATGGGGDTIFVQNGQAVTTNYTIPVGINAMSTGPISINSGVTVTIPANSVWAVI